MNDKIEYTDIDSMALNPVQPGYLPKNAEMVAALGKFVLYHCPKEHPLCYQVWSQGTYVAGFSDQEKAMSYLKARC